MNFLYRQAKKLENNAYSPLYALGIENFILKSMSFDRDRKSVTRKSHYHTYFEVHVLREGHQIYEVDGKRIKVSGGDILFVPPFVRHIALSEDRSTSKYAFSFSLREESELSLSASRAPFSLLHTDGGISENLEFIAREMRERAAYGKAISEGRAVECVMMLFRSLGIKPCAEEVEHADTEDVRVFMIKQYVDDNISHRITVSELASYAYLSKKQLERIFIRDTGCTVMDYVRRQRCKEIEGMLADPRLSLKEISEQLNFASECAFNSFFKKNAGMTPGEYRKSNVK